MARQEATRWWQKHFLVIDALAVGLLLGAIFVFFYSQEGTAFISHLSEWVKNYGVKLFPYIATISGALIGFIITSISIISGFIRDDRSRISMVRGTNLASSIFSVYFHAIISLSITMALTLSGTIIDGEIAGWLLMVIAISVSISVARMTRCLWILWQLTQANAMPAVAHDDYDELRG